MDPADLERKISDRTRAIIPVHMMGAAARILEIKQIADRHALPVIEDNAQSPGASVQGGKLGSFGALGTFSFDPVKTMTTGEGGMVVTRDPELWRAMSEYHDHGHDHLPNPGGRGGEGRRFVGFNFRMMELQGALGLAQLAKLDGIIAAQRANKERLRQAVSVLDGVSFRAQVDAAGDSATFLAFLLPEAGRARAVNRVLREQGAGAVYFAENTWHYYPRWEHLLAGATLARSGWPFQDGGRRRVIYDPKALPQSAAIMDRTLVYQVPVRLSEERLAQIAAAAKAAAKA